MQQSAGRGSLKLCLERTCETLTKMIIYMKFISQIEIREKALWFKCLSPATMFSHMGYNLMIHWFYYLSSLAVSPRRKRSYEDSSVIKFAHAKVGSSSHQGERAVSGAAMTTSHRLSVQMDCQGHRQASVGKHGRPRVTSGLCVLVGCSTEATSPWRP